MWVVKCGDLYLDEYMQWGESREKALEFGNIGVARLLARSLGAKVFRVKKKVIDVNLTNYDVNLLASILLYWVEWTNVQGAEALYDKLMDAADIDDPTHKFQREPKLVVY